MYGSTVKSQIKYNIDNLKIDKIIGFIIRGGVGIKLQRLAICKTNNTVQEMCNTHTNSERQ